jgi:hypothetical protein
MKKTVMGVLSLGLVLALSSVGGSQDLSGEVPVFPAQTVQITTSADLDNSSGVTVTLKAPEKPPLAGDNATVPAEAPPPQDCIVPQQLSVTGVSTRTFFLGIPANICIGVYEIKADANLVVTAGKPSMPIKDISLAPKFIRVTERPPAVTGIDPKGIYQGDSRTLIFLGPSTLKAGSGYTIRFADRALPDCAGKQPAQGAICFQFEKDASQDGQIKFSLLGSDVLSKLAGSRKVSLLHNGIPSAAQDFALVDDTQAAPRNYAIGISVAIVVLIYLLLSAGHKALKGHKGNFLLTELFLDEETSTYSLSKCQFYAWTFAAILGYVFLAVAKSHIQGSAEFPDIPSGLPGILLFSAGTSVAAVGITSSKGSKGSGAVHPTLADFITSGGVVAPERLQFVVWTVVGIFTFLTIVFKSDPLLVSTLPKIPDGFLQLMGISSAGYLGGKLARKAGPVVKTVAVADVTQKGGTLPDKYKPKSEPVLPSQMAQCVLTLNLQGENLDPNAKVRVDGTALRGDQFWITGATPDPQTGFCTEYNLSLVGADTYLTGTHTLTLVNSDSQASDVGFPVDPMSIDSVQAPAAPGGAFTVTGKSFAAKTKYQWSNDKGKLLNDDGKFVDEQGRFVDDQGNFVTASGQPLQPGVANPPADGYPPDAIVEGTTKLTVKGPAAAIPGSKYTLTLVSPVKLRASRPI